ncbi:hypothetical protein Cob_v002254 [Colletotrichum orbiculare MAFF 240422]|uniref:Uncharacterized protein n=1 Tax=Colletotrichum orbiculare (strain 104-T / ATCC 96160 / CBS 514.97 / LARS 414 / MAFF 240422) TaxID=1213857 RepID=A0A484G2G0_COLOR|nr:hypothetical protein Cob_v002254 [Colletotrichum orbiculare MAFF 240422]
MLSMPSLVTVNNNVSLLSITIAPSTYVATLTLSFVFVYLYIVQVSWKPTLVPNFNFFPLAIANTKTTTTTTSSMMATMPPQTFDPLDHLDASLGDFEPTTPPPNKHYQKMPPLFGYPSHHSGFRSELDTESDLGPDPENSVSAGGYSPPAWRRLGNGSRDSGFWRRSEDLLGAFPPSRFAKSRESSPEYDSADEDEDVLRRAIRTRLPTGSMSPDKGRSPSPEPKMDDRTLKLEEIPWKETSPSEGTLNQDNYIRFALRAEVQQRTEPIEAVIDMFRSKWRLLTHSWSSTILSLLVATLALPALRAHSSLLFTFLKTVHRSNMTSAPIIVKELDGLSDSLKTLAIELTKFFANVDGDIDGILIVMDWARRELSHVQHLPSTPFTAAFDNIHNMLSQTGVLEDPVGQPTRLGSMSTYVFGMSNPQRTRLTLQRTFNEFLTVLEDAINSELQHSLALFALFESIDQQFLNLARTVVREASAQDDMHADTLSSLWTRILGANAAEVAKYERNRLLLQNVRERTVRNKSVLVEHNGKLLALKANLENLRRKLVSPLVRSVNSSTLTLQDQIRGLEDVGGYLEGVRTRQKGKLMEMLYGNVGNSRRMIDDRTYDRTA